MRRFTRAETITIIRHLDAWNEADHPRGSDGKFGTGSGGSTPRAPRTPKIEEARIVATTGATPVALGSVVRGRDEHGQHADVRLEISERDHANADKTWADVKNKLKRQMQKRLKENDGVKYEISDIPDESVAPYVMDAVMKSKGLGEIHKRVEEGWLQSSGSHDALEFHNALASFGIDGTLTAGDGSPDLYKPTSKMKRYVKELYLTTQAGLRANGVKKIRLYRGVGNVASDVQKGDTVSIATRHASSWAADPKHARMFSGTVVKATFPAGAIISSQPLQGNDKVSEYVVLGASTQTVKVHRAGDRKTIYSSNDTTEEDLQTIKQQNENANKMLYPVPHLETQRYLDSYFKSAGKDLSPEQKLKVFSEHIQLGIEKEQVVVLHNAKIKAYYETPEGQKDLRVAGAKMVVKANGKPIFFQGDKRTYKINGLEAWHRPLRAEVNPSRELIMARGPQYSEELNVNKIEPSTFAAVQAAEQQARTIVEPQRKAKQRRLINEFKRSLEEPSP